MVDCLGLLVDILLGYCFVDYVVKYMYWYMLYIRSVIYKYLWCIYIQAHLYDYGDNFQSS